MYKRQGVDFCRGSGVIVHDKASTCEICKTSPTSLKKEIPSKIVRSRDNNGLKKGCQGEVLLATLKGKQP